ncbi:MAG: flagellar hook-associated protein FlgL [Candidatus Cloacimonetes bacterium]|nr:flagellar hook-associated protein FlgL [Candidatus Cloacimonadota bacterium]
MRVTDQSMFHGLINQVNKNLSDYHKYNEMVANDGKRLNRISDNPAELATAMRHHGNAAAYEQYTLNVRDAEEYLKATDLALNKIHDILSRAREIAETNSTESSSEMERKIAADQIQELISEMIGIANTKMRDRYIFSGTNGENPAYSLEGKILPPLASTDNVYNEIVTTEGVLKGTGEFIVRFVHSGDVGDPDLDTTAMYQISNDGGETWTEATYFTNLTIAITDSAGNDTGLTMTFSPGYLSENDEFRVQVVPGQFMGNGDLVEFNNNMFSRVNTNVTGQALFEDTGFFDTLYQLKNALSYGNTIEISNGLAGLESLQTNIQMQVTSTGIELNRLEVTKSNLMMLQENVFENIQSIEKIDVVELLSKFAMAENALNSSVAALSKIFPRGLLSYL